MEGVSHEAWRSPATEAVEALIFLYDDNGITIDGPITLRQCRPGGAFRPMAGNAVHVDGHDQRAIGRAITQAAVVRPALDDRLQDHHRLRRPTGGDLEAHGERPPRTGRRQEALGWNYGPSRFPTISCGLARGRQQGASAHAE